MPKRTDISTILIIGAGPIVIGQACEFDYSGTQAVKTLKEEGFRIVLVNSNPATIMTDPELADATYIEPITPEIVAKIIEKERHVIPGGFALLPTMGGQTALNCALSLRRQGTLAKFDVEMIGATADAIDKAEDRQLFRNAMQKIGLQTPRSRLANASALKKSYRDKYLADREKLSGSALEEVERQWALGENERRKRYQEHALGEALMALSEIGLPAIIRPSFTMGGTGGGIAYNKEEFLDIIERGLDASPTNEVLIEESVLGWKEFEMEVVRDKKDNCIIICSIENLDPMGVHTGDSITVAPALTLTDKEYQIIDRGAARDRGGDRRLQRAVRRQSGRRAHGGDRDEPAGVALFGAGLQSHGISDRQSRRKTRGRLHARRDRQRHHRRRDAGLVRADHRLRRHQDPALCVREVSRRLDHVDHFDEIGRRSDGDRPHLSGEPAKGAARPGDRPDRVRRDRDRGVGARRRQERDPRRARHADAEPHPAGRTGDAAGLVQRRHLQLLQDRSLVPL
jgi:carbamoylphosphate synthase large subunit